MRIYLDSCILQDLKKPENEELLDLVMMNKPHNIYCYSEAHLQDLLRDKSEWKYKDVQFISTIVDDNCWYYDKKTIIELFGADYYENGCFSVSEIDKEENWCGRIWNYEDVIIMLNYQDKLTHRYTYQKNNLLILIRK